jgi:hypothetical protein
MNNLYSKYKICVSGAAETDHCGPDSFLKAEELGREIIKQGAILINGSTTGFPYWAAKGAKAENGLVIGVSPAETESEHLNIYKLPIDYQDLILYTGFGYAGRNLLLTRLADAIVVGCGRIGTINEFTIAFEDKKPLGILEGNWVTDELIKAIVEKSHRATEMKDKIIFSNDPKELIAKIIQLITKEKKESRQQSETY